MAKSLEQLKAEKAKIDAQIAAAEKKTGTKKEKESTEHVSANLDDQDSDFTGIVKDTRMVVFKPQMGAELMGKPGLREQDQKPQRFFFYNNLRTKEIVCYTEAEAARMMESSWAIILEQIGCSDGSTYWKHLHGCGIKSGERVPLARAQEALRGAFNAELEAARGHFDDPMPQNYHIDNSIRRHKNARSIIAGLGI